ncbi:MAG: hypothetical protein QOH84_1632 [Kribbellaceae bacterium]|nr:hypothetical protein [Kribbellaceae bacterium]
MEWLLIVLGGGGVAAAGRYVWARRAGRRKAAAELADIRWLADDDVTHFGEQLSRLDESLAGRELDADTRYDYQAALDAYEQAKRAAPRLHTRESISAVVDLLTEGRYALACVQARAAGRPLPERRVPCYFNPQHGPSTADVVWTPPKGGTRRVPVCAQDAARIAAGTEPEVHYIRYGELNVPYWEAGDPNEPYRFGLFDSGGARAIAINLRLQQLGIDAGRGRKDPGLLPRKRGK